MSQPTWNKDYLVHILSSYPMFGIHVSSDHFDHAPSQWEMMLQCNVISHWLDTYTIIPVYMRDHCQDVNMRYLGGEWLAFPIKCQACLATMKKICLHSLISCGVSPARPLYPIEAEIKYTPFCRWHFQCIFYEDIWISINISLKFVLRG